MSNHVVDGRRSPHALGNIRARLNSGDVLFPLEEVGWPGMFAHLMNDPRPTGYANVHVCEPHGVVCALKQRPLCGRAGAASTGLGASACAASMGAPPPCAGAAGAASTCGLSAGAPA
ncbi:hypothetical protein OEZ85_012273 [Tetradesmus obliquus]|uniref:Uncharacterized protein n=1 Tax=Tetradesmus obliquus TaxID=3088 RepID=A0ABY8TSU9_TETOB|nr:hypothetical protein OEZ85_012273 [Tetradesmus obliquus]